MNDDDRLIVLGRASGEIAPDRIEWTLIVREVDADPRAAFDRCSARLNALAEGLGMAELETGEVGVAPQYEDYNKRTGRHEAKAALTAVAPLALGSAVARAAMDSGADELRGPRLEIPDAEETMDALFAEAVQAARRRAERMAEAAGRRLGRVLSVRDRRAHSDFEDDIEGVEMMARGGGSNEPPTVIAGPRTLVAAVVVVFELL